MTSVLEQLHAVRAAKRQQDILADINACKGSLSNFIRLGWPVLKPVETYKHNWHIDAMCEKLEAVSGGEIKNLLIWVPPGTMKSMTVSVFWPAWEWTDNPWLRYWGASYEVRLAGRLAAMSRDLMMSDWYQERWGDVFRFIREGEGYYGNDQGGTRLSTAPNSTGSGEHGHRILVDDPINAKQADATSKVTLNETNDWWDGTVSTRGVGDMHAKVIIMQRLHQNDLSGHVLEEAEEDDIDWEVLCLPERYEPDHPFVWPEDPRTEDGQLLWPEHRGEKASNALARQLTSHRAAGQLQQRPSAREGGLLKIAWWRFYDPRIRAQERWAELPKFRMIVLSVDTPLKDKETSDNVAIQTWGVFGADRYLLDLRLAKMNYGLAKRTLIEMSKYARTTWPGASHHILIENAGYGVELITDMKRVYTGVIKIAQGAEGDKELRAESASDALESGNCFLPGYGPPWQEAYKEALCPADVVEFLVNCTLFPHAKNDDDVDAWSQCQNWLRSRMTAPMRTSRATRQLDR